MVQEVTNTSCRTSKILTTYLLRIFVITLLLHKGSSFKVIKPRENAEGGFGRSYGGDSGDCPTQACTGQRGVAFFVCLMRCNEEPALATTTTLSPFRRQVDPFKSCIEAKCSGTGHEYMPCMIEQCLVGAGLGDGIFQTRRSSNKDVKKSNERSLVAGYRNSIDIPFSFRLEAVDADKALGHKRFKTDPVQKCLQAACPDGDLGCMVSSFTSCGRR